MLFAKTNPYKERLLFFLEARRDKRVVFPAPDGPMIANISPGLQHPETLFKISLF